MQSLKKLTWEHCLWDISVIIWCVIMKMHIWNLKYLIPIIDCDADIMTCEQIMFQKCIRFLSGGFDVPGLGDGWVITVISSLFFQFAKKEGRWWNSNLVTSTNLKPSVEGHIKSQNMIPIDVRKIIILYCILFPFFVSLLIVYQSTFWTTEFSYQNFSTVFDPVVNTFYIMI